MESTEKCEAIIQHFNGKFIKTPPGVPGVWNVLCHKNLILLLPELPTLVTEFTLLSDVLLLLQCPQSPYYVSLQTEVRRRGRTRGSTFRMEGPGLETETR